MTITKEDVLAFLKENPKFLDENPDVFEALIPEKKRGRRGQPADFQAYMIDRLKNEREEEQGHRFVSARFDLAPDDPGGGSPEQGRQLRHKRIARRRDVVPSRPHQSRIHPDEQQARAMGRKH